jgi:hypothetical protein
LLKVPVKASWQQKEGHSKKAKGANEMSRKQMNFIVDEDLHTKAKAFAVVNRVSLREMLLRGLVHQLEKGKLCPSVKAQTQHSSCHQN